MNLDLKEIKKIRHHEHLKFSTQEWESLQGAYFFLLKQKESLFEVIDKENWNQLLTKVGNYFWRRYLKAEFINFVILFN